MKQTLWIWSSRNQWWTTGNYTITHESYLLLGWRQFRYTAYNYWNLELCKRDPLSVPSHRDLKLRLASQSWKPLTPEQVASILDDTSTYQEIRESE